MISIFRVKTLFLKKINNHGKAKKANWNSKSIETK